MELLSVPEKYQIVTRISSKHQKCKKLKFSKFFEANVFLSSFYFFSKMNVKIL